jgi:transcriptional regulator with XRE-family HTH domain
MTFNILHLTGEQIRAARALARIEQTELARRASLSLETIKRLERIRGPVEANARTLRSIQRAFETIGITFHGDETGRVGVSRYPEAEQLVQEADKAAKPLADRLRRLIYHGKLTQTSDVSLRPVLASLHSQVSTLHRELGLTGLTLVAEGVVLQALEGDQEAVETAYQRLNSAAYHDYLTLIDDRPAGQRVFSDMGFCCGRFSEDLRYDGEGLLPTLPFKPARLSATEAVAILMAARKRQQETPRNDCLIPSACGISDRCLDTRCNAHSHGLNRLLNPQVQGNVGEG